MAIVIYEETVKRGVLVGGTIHDNCTVFVHIELSKYIWQGRMKEISKMDAG